MKNDKNTGKNTGRNAGKNTGRNTEKYKGMKTSKNVGVNEKASEVKASVKRSPGKSMSLERLMEYEDFEDFKDDEVLKELLKNSKTKNSKTAAEPKKQASMPMKKGAAQAGSSCRQDRREYGKGNPNHKTESDSRQIRESGKRQIQEGKAEGLTQKPKKQAYACPYLRECGGCNILKQSYEEELKFKQTTVDDLLKSFCHVEPIIGMKNPEHYRNKVHVVFDHDKKGNPISGVYEEGTHRVIPIERCLIHNKKADEIIKSIRGLLKSFKIKTYDEDSGYGLLRHVLIRTGFASGQIMVVLVLASPIFPSKNNFVKALRELHSDITTIVVNVNDKQTSMVLGEKEQVIYGKGFIEDKLCNKVFRISPKSFYQVNPAQTEIIYGKAIEMAGLTGTETVVDAYCGIGTIGIIAADQANKVIGVELNKDAVKDAIINAKQNDTKNIDFYHNDAGEFMTQMAEQKEKVEVVFMDPPRTGSTEKFIDAVALLKPDKVVYVSCNPVTLERDLKYFREKGYRAKKAVPVDMFPWTSHVETVVLISR